MKRMPAFGLISVLAFLTACGGGGGSSPAQTQPTYTPPPVPSQVAASAGSSYGVIHLSWTADLEAVDWLTIEAKTAGGTYALFADHVAPAPSAQDFSLPATLPELATITFRIYANAHSMKSAYSSEAVFTNGIAPATTIAATWSSPGIQVSWDHPSLVATGIRLERTEIQNGIEVGWGSLPNVAVNDTGYTDTAVQDLTTYKYRVTYTAGAQSSQTATMPNPIGVPFLPPTDLQAAIQPDGSVHLTWINHSTHAATLTLLRSRSTESDGQIGSYQGLTTIQTDYVDPTPAPGYYTYALWAFDGYMTYIQSASVLVYLPGAAGDLTFTHSTHLMPELASLKWFRSSSGQWGYMGDPGTGTGPVIGWETDQGPVNQGLHLPPSTLIEPGPMVDFQDRVHFFTLTALQSSGARIDHYTFSGTTVSSEEVSQSATYSTFRASIADLDSQDGLHLLCPDEDNVTTHRLDQPSGTWLDTSVSLPTQSASQPQVSLSVSSAGASFLSSTVGPTLVSLAGDGSAASEVIPDAGNDLTNGSLTMAALGNGTVVAIYTTGPGSPIMAVSKIAGAWSSPVQLMAWNYGDNQKTRVSISRNGSRLAVVAYDGQGNLAVATTQDGSTWKKASVATSPDFGSLFKIGFTPADKLWIDVDSDYVAIGTLNAIHTLFEEP